MQILYELTFQRNVLPPSSGQKNLREQVAAAADAASSLADFSTLKMEVIRSSETSAHTRSTPCSIPEDGILHSHCCEKPQISYICLHSIF
jgi:hypothetical protein